MFTLTGAPTTDGSNYNLWPWMPLSLSSGWTAKSGTGTNLPPIGYRQTGATIQLRGEINPPGVLTGNLLILTLPAAVSPPFEYVFPAAVLGLLGAGGVRVYPNGEVRLEGITALTSMTLNAVRFTLN